MKLFLLMIAGSIGLASTTVWYDGRDMAPWVAASASIASGIVCVVVVWFGANIVGRLLRRPR